MKSRGISTATREMVREMMVKPICPAPMRAASRGLCPSSRYRAIFSMTTMASSTTKPVAMTRAMRVRLLSEKPARCMTPSDPTSERGTARAGMSVARPLRKNSQITPMTRPMESSSSSCTSCTVARMVTVRSVTTRTLTWPGRVCCSTGSRRSTPSATPMTLAPGCRCTESTMAGRKFPPSPAT